VTIIATHPDVQIQVAIDEMHSRLEKIRLESGNPYVDLILERYAAGARAFCPGAFFAQDLNNRQNRLRDLIGGWPYTSDSHPWPKMDEDGLFMQPLIQIELTRAGNLLGINLGGGLLQVWGAAFRDFGEVLKRFKGPFLTRIIPMDDLSTPPSDFVPDIFSWNDGQFQLSTTGIEVLMIPSENCEFRTTPLVEWKTARPMFGTYWHLYNSLTLEEEDAMGGSDEYYPIATEIDDKLADSPLSMHQHSIYLGGLGGAAGGNEDPSFDVPLLIRLNDGGGFHFAVKLNADRQQKMNFEPVYRVRSC